MNAKAIFLALSAGTLSLFLTPQALCAETAPFQEMNFRSGKTQGWVIERKKPQTSYSLIRENGVPLLRFETTLRDGSEAILYAPLSRIPAASPYAVKRRLTLRLSALGPALPEDNASVRIIFSRKRIPAGWLVLRGTDGKRGIDGTIPGGGAQCRDLTFTTDLPADIDPDIRLFFFLRSKSGKASLLLRKAELSVSEEKRHQLTTGWKANIVPLDSGELKLSIAPGEVRSGHFTLKNETGKTILEQTIRTAAPLRIPLREKGWYEAEAAVNYKDGSRIVTKATAAVVGPALPDEIHRNSKYGFSPISMPEDLALYAGCRWYWHIWNINLYKRGADGKVTGHMPDWERKEYEEWKKSKIAYHHVFGGNFPDWIADPKKRGIKCAPADWKGFYDVVKAWAEVHSFRAKEEAFSVFNEINNSWRGTDEELVKLHSVAAKAIRAGAPGAKVFGPAASNVSIPYLKRLVDLGLLNDLDGVSAHPYVWGTAPEGKFMTDIIRYMEYLRSIGKGDMPVHFTEFGWTTLPGTWQAHVDELTQAQYVSRSFALLSTTGIASAVYFAGWYLPKNEGEHGFSLLRRDMSPKPSYAAIAKAIKTLTPFGTSGRWIKASETTHLVLHKRPEGGLLVIAWSTDGKGVFPAPASLTSMTDMMGRKLPPFPSGSMMKLTESPVYLETNDMTLWDKIRIQAVRRTSPGSAERLNAGNGTLFLVPAPLKVTNGTVFFPEKIPFGDYTVFVQEKTGMISGIQFKVVDPVSISGIELVWPKDAGRPGIRVVCEAQRRIAAGGTISWRVHGRQAQTRKLGTMDTGKGKEFFFPLAENEVQPGKWFRGEASVSYPVNGRLHPLKKDFSFLIQVCNELRKNDFSAIPWFSTADWLRFGELATEIPDPYKPEECSGKLRTAWNQKGLFIHLDVRDDHQIQNRNAGDLWMDDSIQLAFDVDAGKPWTVNNMVQSFNGHRIFEYGFGLGKNGQTLAFRWRAHGGNLTPGIPDGVESNITRSNGVTHYRIFFPWRTLGLTRAPERGSTIGFAAAINDRDPEGKRHGLRLFGGITNSKDPKEYGTLLIR